MSCAVIDPTYHRVSRVALRIITIASRTCLYSVCFHQLRLLSSSISGVIFPVIVRGASVANILPVHGHAGTAMERCPRRPCLGRIQVRTHYPRSLVCALLASSAHWQTKRKQTTSNNADNVIGFTRDVKVACWKIITNGYRVAVNGSCTIPNNVPMEQAVSKASKAIAPITFERRVLKTEVSVERKQTCAQCINSAIWADQPISVLFNFLSPGTPSSAS